MASGPGSEASRPSKKKKGGGSSKPVSARITISVTYLQALTVRMIPLPGATSGPGFYVTSAGPPEIFQEENYLAPVPIGPP